MPSKTFPQISEELAASNAQLLQSFETLMHELEKNLGRNKKQNTQPNSE